MTDTWYYGAEDKAVGPLSLIDLKAILAREFDARNLLVWRSGFTQWQKADTVPELEAFVIKPPPIPPSTPSGTQLPLDQTLRVDNQEPGSGAPNIRAQAPQLYGLHSIGDGNGDSDWRHSLSHTFQRVYIAPRLRDNSGSWRQDFVSGGMDTCVRNQESISDAKPLSLSKDVINRYCSCYMNTLADTVTYGEVKAAAKDGGGALKTKVDSADAKCIDQMRRSLLGGH
jgi:hypothetical protein